VRDKLLKPRQLFRIFLYTETPWTTYKLPSLINWYYLTEEQKSILDNKRTFGWGLKIVCTIKSSIQEHRGLLWVSHEQRNDHKTQFAWNVWGTDMLGERKWADTLINTVLSAFKMYEGEMKLITCNVEVSFKKQYLVYPDEKQSVQNGQQDPSDDSRNENHLHFCKIQNETFIILTSIWRRSIRFRGPAGL